MQCSIGISRLIINFIINFRMRVHIFYTDDCFFFGPSITLKIKSTETEPLHNEERERGCDQL